MSKNYDERFVCVACVRASKPGKFHRIMHDNTRKITGCTCTGYIYYKHCKHMDAYNANDKSKVVSPATALAETLGGTLNE